MSELTSRVGVAAAQLAVNKIDWFFREQPISDQGVDAIVEDVEITVRKSGQRQEEGTGRLLALQIKGGPSWFVEESATGWWFRFDLIHARRWFNLSVPVALVLVNTESNVCYWQEISPRSVVEAGQGFKVEVPATRTVSSAAEAWRVLASEAAAVAAVGYETSMAHLPPSARKTLQSIGVDTDLDVQLLAYHLAEGRHNPEGTVQSLITGEPLWVTRHAPASWAAIGEYAALHGQCELAAAVFERAATADVQQGTENPRAQYLATAALHLIDADRARAGDLVDQADAAGAPHHVVAILRALVNHPVGDARPVDIPDSVNTEAEPVRKSAFVQSVLAISAQRAGDVRAALRHSCDALAADPENSTAMAHRAEILLWASQADHNDEPTFATEGMDLLQQALAQRHEWDGPTLNLTLHLARACVLYGRYHTVLGICLPAPDGSATDTDARDPQVQRLALAAAASLNRRALARRIADSMSDTHADLLIKNRAGLLKAGPDQVRTWMQGDLDDAIAREDYLRIAQSGLALAQVGIDTTQLLQPYVERSILPADTPSLISALVAAYADLDSALPQLRALARTSLQAAVVLLGLLETAGRSSEALTVCDAILARRREPAVVVSRVQLLIAEGDPEAEQAALDAAAELSGFSIERRMFLTFAAGKAAECNNWELAAQRLQEVLNLAGSPQAGGVWKLVLAHLQTGRVDRARYIINKHQPEVRDLNEAEYWLRAHSATKLDAAKATEALSLAERFNHPRISTALLSLIITGTHGVDPTRDTEDTDAELDERRRLALTEVPAELHVQAFEVLNRLDPQAGADWATSHTLTTYPCSY